MDDQELVRAAMSVIGKRKTPRKAQSSAENAVKARQARKPPLPCNCHQIPHTSKCVVYLREKQRIHRQKKETGQCTPSDRK
jgi:hypothetical protein